MPLSFRSSVVSANCPKPTPVSAGCHLARGTSTEHFEDTSRRAGSVGLLDCFGATDVGMVREQNEDQFLIADMRLPRAILHTHSCRRRFEQVQGISRANLLLVADGVGGNFGGKEASKLAVDAIVEFLASCGQSTPCLDDNPQDRTREELMAALLWAQRRIAHKAARFPDLARMGSTLTLAYLDWPQAYIAHVGDSRAYLYRRQNLLQLTQDQTLAHMLAEARLISTDLVKHHRLRHVLGSLLCADASQFSPCIYQTCLIPGDQLLLCTDGLTKHVSDERIAEILDSACSAACACRELVGAANAAGGTDNVTAVVARFGSRLDETVEMPAVWDGSAVQQAAL